MSEKPSYTATEKAQYLRDQYTAIVADVFPGVISLDEFITTFNAFFVRYQQFNKKKMLPESLREGDISCSSAAAITGMWWFIVNSIEPTYFVEQIVRDSGSSKSAAHVVVALPSDVSEPQSQAVDAAYLARGQGKQTPGIAVVDYTLRYGLDHASPKLISPNKLKISGNYAYLLNRVRVMGIKSNAISEKMLAKT